MLDIFISLSLPGKLTLSPLRMSGFIFSSEPVLLTSNTGLRKCHRRLFTTSKGRKKGKRDEKVLLKELD
jgi:hypothetical protein